MRSASLHGKGECHTSDGVCVGSIEGGPKAVPVKLIRMPVAAPKL